MYFTSIHTYKHTYISTYIHAGIHNCKHLCYTRNDINERKHSMSWLPLDQGWNPCLLLPCPAFGGMRGPGLATAIHGFTGRYIRATDCCWLASPGRWWREASGATCASQPRLTWAVCLVVLGLQLLHDSHITGWRPDTGRATLTFFSARWGAAPPYPAPCRIGGKRVCLRSVSRSRAPLPRRAHGATQNQQTCRRRPRGGNDQDDASHQWSISTWHRPGQHVKLRQKTEQSGTIRGKTWFLCKHGRSSGRTRFRL